VNPEDLARERRWIERDAKRALRASDLVLPSGARVLQALPVYDFERALHDWFVPVIAQDRLVAYLRFMPEHTLKGISTFARRPERIDDCPLAADWLDEKHIASRARSLCASGETPGEPMLSFDGAPDRIAWAVPLQGSHGQRWVFVAGRSVWAARG
jgi:hypothetical protein